MLGAACTVSVPLAKPVPAALKRVRIAEIFVGDGVGSRRQALDVEGGAETAAGADRDRLGDAVERDGHVVAAGATDPAAMWPLTVTVDVPTLTAGDERLLNAGVALLMTSVPLAVEL